MQQYIDQIRPIVDLLDKQTWVAIGGGALGLFVLLWCRIFSKAGYSFFMGLLMLVPVVNIFVFCMLGLGRWPIEREAGSFREMQRSVHKADRSMRGAA
jgi:hypothetical protein